MPFSFPSSLGVTLVAGGAVVAVVAPAAERVVVCLFDAAGDEETSRHLLSDRQGDLHVGFVPGLVAGTRYGLRADGRGRFHDPAKLLVDPYATRLDRPFRLVPELARPRADAIDTAPVMPKAIVEAPGRPMPRGPRLDPAERVIYEISVRAHTRLHPDVPEDLRGTLGALAHPAVIDRLRALGVTTLELMPLHAAIDERHLPALGLTNAWGYNPVAFLAPDPRLVPGGMDEVRQTLSALHEAGFEVLLDVVFNHTGESDALGPTLSLRGLDEAAYFRFNGDALDNVTGCGNTLALDRPSALRLTMDALRHWALAGFDGFRFDLGSVLGRTEAGFSPHAPLLQALAQDPVLCDRALIAEPWDIGPGGYQLGGFAAPWLEWNDRYRDDVRRFFRGDHGARSALATRLAGSADLFQAGYRRPTASVNFIAAHDGFTLSDLVTYRFKRNLANGEAGRDGTDENHSWNHGVEGPTDRAEILSARARDARALLATLFLSRGTPMLTAGDEFGRTQGGNNNAYAQDNETTWLDWARADQDREHFVQALIALRRAHPVVGDDRFLTGQPERLGGEPDVAWYDVHGERLEGDAWQAGDTSHLVMVLTAPDAADGPGERVAVTFHAGHGDRPLILPAPREGYSWRLRLDSAAGDALIDRAYESGDHVPGRAVLLHVERADPRARSRAPSDGAVGQLAELAGIAPDWWSVEGRHTIVRVETQRALLSAMGLRTETLGDVEEHRYRLLERRRARMLPPAAVVAQTGGAIDLWVPSTELDRPIRLRAALDDGGEAVFDVVPGHLIETETARFDGIERSRRRVPLDGLPIGRHTLTQDEAGVSSALLVAPQRCRSAADLLPGGRGTGLSAQLYTLVDPNDQGIADLSTLGRLAAFAGANGHAVLGVNPLHCLFPTDRSRASPYHPSDRAFIDPMLIDIAAAAEALGATDVLASLDALGPALEAERARRLVDYPAVWAVKDRLIDGLMQAIGQPGGDDALSADLFRFAHAGGAALERFALFQAISRMAGTTDRRRWPEVWREVESAEREPLPPDFEALAERAVFEQWVLDRQLGAAAAKGASGGLSLGLYRDLAVGPAPDGAEVWRAPEVYLPGCSIGAPPDPFSATGQVWNLPPMDPLALARTAGRAFGDLVAANLRHAGALRIDHAMGLQRLFLVPEGAPAGDGAYVAMPADILFASLVLESHRADALIVGEDLGTVPEGFAERMAERGVLSTRVVLFERHGLGFTPPERYRADAVACFTTHDLPTVAGWRQARDAWLEQELGRIDEEEARARARTREDEVTAFLSAAGASAHDEMVEVTERFLARTPCVLSLTQVDDLAGETEPVNVPGTDREHPNWRRRLDWRIEG
jgi:glycogen debranching enzyme GlgX/4-alpha-glucanotransferase